MLSYESYFLSEVKQIFEVQNGCLYEKVYFYL